MKKLNLGIIGSGFALYGLLPAFQSIDNCNIISVCVKNHNLLSKQKIKTYIDWRLMLKQEKLDALAIAVNPKNQYAIAKYAIQKGIHIFAEKPLAANHKQAKKLLDLAKKNKITHAIDFIFPEIAEFKKVKELIDSKAYGNLKHIMVSWDFLGSGIKIGKESWKTNALQGGGALSFYFSHSFYYLEYFAGKILDIKSQLVYSKESINGTEEGANILIKFENGTLGLGHINCNAKGLNRHQLIFTLEKATIILENKYSVTDNFKITIYSEKSKKKLTIHKKKITKNEDERVKEVTKIAIRFVNACINKKQMKPSFKEGSYVQQLIKKARLG